MAYFINVTVDYFFVPAGTNAALLGQNQSNQPGFAASLAAGSIGDQQSGRLQVAEVVPGGNSPTLANFLTALQNAAQDLAGTPSDGSATPIMSQSGALGGAPGTALANIQTWATGIPANN